MLAAGAGSVIASQWRVADEPMALMMRSFYQAALDDGLPIAAALRKAQLALLESKWRSPAFWAPLTVTVVR